MTLSQRRVGRIEVQHRGDCSAIACVNRGDWDTPWGPLDRERPQTFRDSLGRKNHGSHYWLRFVCNDTRCPGRLLVPTEPLLRGALHV